MDCMYLKNLSLLFSCLIASVALVVSIWNSRISKEKIRLDLYDKRFKIYLNVQNYCLIFIHSKWGKLHDEANFDNFIRAYRESKFLFSIDSTVYNKIEEILQITANLKSYQEKKEESSYESKEKNITSNLSLNNKLTELEDAMRPYLQFTVLTKRKSI